MQENSKIGRSLKQISQPVQKRERWLTLTTKKPRLIAKIIQLITCNLNRNPAYPAQVRNFSFSLSPKTMYSVQVVVSSPVRMEWADGLVWS